MTKLIAFVPALLLVAACAGPGAASKPATAQQPAKPAAAQAKPPGRYTPNGAVDASSGKAATQLLDTMKFQPSEITGVKPGQTIALEMKNVGATIHNFYAPVLGVASPVRVSPGQTGTVTFTAPAEPGTYQYWCNEPGHGEAGMIGQVVVQ